MCGVVSIVYKKNNSNLGKTGSDLLKKLEYRGYDSTGGMFIKQDRSYILKKKVGAPSKVTEELEMDKMSGRKFIGQVRWATYGAVTDENAQPHTVKCKIEVLGAHNGNISNTDSLKEFLISEGHKPASDNDGEMLVHLVEHYYHRYLPEFDSLDESERIKAFTKAIRKAETIAEGSYAACITVTDIEGVFAIKSGSSLYAGKGSDENGDFIVVSSDLTSVLSKTRFLIPLSEGEGLYFTDNRWEVFSLKEERAWIPDLTKSRLNISDISLAPKYHYFMEQEIHTSASNLDNIIKYYFNKEEELVPFGVFEEDLDSCRNILYSLLKLYDVFDKKSLKKEYTKVVESETFCKVSDRFRTLNILGEEDLVSVGFVSEDAALLEELLEIDEKYSRNLYILDRMLLWKKKRMIIRFKNSLANQIKKTSEDGGRIFAVASGTSCHAAMLGSYFFNNLSDISIIPANPGTFRSQYINSVSSKDMVIGISQSGETKDLVDIYNELKEKCGNDFPLISIVNNENSTLPQEKSSFYLPVMCGPEIAVAATKSFTSQLALLYIIASEIKNNEVITCKMLEKIRYYLNFTLNNEESGIAEVALKLFHKPSIHILGTSLKGLSKEGALKVREVVLNHTEGYDSAEFKHGPNTILGKNTLFSFQDMEALQLSIFEAIEEVINSGKKFSMQEYLGLVKNFRLKTIEDEEIICSNDALKDILDIYRKKVDIENHFSNYPLVFICPPNERDKRITITQIHTHKIRGADIILIAEKDKELKKAVEGKPANNENYFSKYIEIPFTGDRNIFVFQAAVILQILALKMSVSKMKYLNRNKVEQHGVHPDVPKNVSKSITVD